MLAAAVALVGPVLASAQPYSARGTPVPFTGPMRTYTVSGCGSGPLSYQGGSAVPIFCLTGFATVGVATASNGTQFFQTVLDLTGTRLGGFTARFYDVDYSSILFNTTIVNASGSTSTGSQAYAPAQVDLTGRTLSAYIPLLPVDSPGLPGVRPDGLTFGTSGLATLGYVPTDAPGGSVIDYGRRFQFALSVTAVPEPATLALTLGGLAVLGAGAWKRRRV